LESRFIKPAGTLVKCSKCQDVFKVFPPEPVDPRKYKRVKTQNLISYFCFDKAENMTSQGLGIAMDISKGGILLETPCPIKPGRLVLSATDLDKNLMELRGKLIHSTRSASGTYLSGIEFVGVDGRVKDFITRLILEYNYRGSNLFIAVTRKAAPSRTAPIPLN
jgi:c-di-GMP-binding flagellar brake protein YcgR